MRRILNRFLFILTGFIPSSLYSKDNIVSSLHKTNTATILFIFLGLLLGTIFVLVIVHAWNKQLQIAVNKAVFNLQHSEEKYREIFHSTSDAIFIHEANTGKILDVNNAMLEMYGYDSVKQVQSPQYIKETFCCKPYDIEHVQQYMKKTIDEGPQLFEWCAKKKSGETFWVEVSLKLSQIDNQSLILAVVRDINKRKLAEQALHDSEDKYQTIFNSTTNAIFIHDAHSGKILEVNNMGLQMFGFTSLNDITDQKVSSLSSGLEGYTQENLLKNIRKCVNKGAQIFEWQGKNKQGKLFWTEVTLKHYKIGEQDRVMAVVRNIDQFKKIQQEAREHFDTMKAFIEALPGLAMIIDKNKKITLVNQAICTSLGVSREELRGSDMSCFLDPGILEARSRQIDMVINSATGYQWEDERENRYFYHYISPIVDKEGEVTSVAIFTLDITQRKIFEKYNNRLATALEQSAEAISIITSDGKVEYINPAFEEILGYKKDRIIGKEPFYIMQNVWDERSALTPKQSMESGVVWQGLIPHKTDSGEIIELNTSITPIVKQNDIMGMVTIQRDETTLRKLESDLRQAQKMEAIGSLAGGIAHDFNNILMGIMGYTEMAQMIAHSDDNLAEYLDQVLNSAIRAKELVEQILSFSRKSEYSKRIMSLKPVIQQVLKLIRSIIPTTIKIVTEFDSDKLVLANSTQIHQIIMNFCTNASHAMPKGGILSIQVSEIDTQDIKTSYVINPDIQSFMLVKISDTGTGISDVIIQRIFEPYFTTKEHDKGTGMGLSVVQNIVKNHDGFIEVESVLHKGTVFSVYLPVTQGTQIEVKNVKESSDENNRKYKILVVDDELTIVNLIDQYLNSRGYDVTSFSDASEAEIEIKKNLSEYDVIITDMTMPYMTGLELLKLIRSIDKRKAVILCSGNESETSGQEEEFLFIEKPMKLNELDKMIVKAISK